MHPGSPPPSTRPLIERDDAIAVLDGAFARASSGSGSTVCVSGAAGTGRTALLEYARVEAQARGFRVLAVHGDKLERDLPYGVAVGLLEPLVSGSVPPDAVFEGRAGLCRPLFDARPVPIPGLADLQAIAQGLYWLVANATEVRPLVLVVDDVDQCDLPSLRCLRYLTRRLADLPLVVLVSTSPAPDGPAGDLVGRDTIVVKLAPLTRDGVARAVAGDGPAPADDDIDRWYSVTGGLPVFVADLIDSVEAVDRPERHATSAHTTVEARLERLPAPARDLLASAAIAGPGTPWWQVARLAPSTSAPDTDVAALRRHLADAALVLLTDPVEFVQPIVRDAVLVVTPDETARRIHGALARDLLATGAAPESIARHLLACDPLGEAAAAEALAAAARRSQGSVTPDLAVSWLRRAMLEGPTGDLRTEIVGRLALAAARAGDVGWPDDLDRWLRTVEGPVETARLRLRVARSLMTAGLVGEATALLKTALHKAGDADLGRVRMQLLVTLASGSRIEVDHRASIEDQLEAELSRAGNDDDPLTRAVLGHLAYHRSLGSGPAALVSELGRRSILHPGIADEEVLGSVTWVQVILALLFADDADACESGIRRGLVVAEHHGNELLYAVMRNYRTSLRVAQGRVEEALDDGAAAVRLMRLDQSFSLPGATGNLAFAQALGGHLDDATATLDGLEVCEATLIGTPFTNYLYCRGSIRLLHDDIGGLEDLRAVLERQRTNNSLNPAVFPAALLVAEHIAGDAPAEAAALIDEAAALAEAFGAPRPLAAVARARAALEPRRAVAHLSHADDLLAATPWGLDRVRTRLALGDALLRVRRTADARARFAQALDEAEAGGVVLFAEHARDRLVSTGARPRRAGYSGPDSLTPAERDVVELAVGGLTNRQIAARRFVSVKAVEFHLANAYRKLGVSRRTDLPEAMSQARPAVADGRKPGVAP